MLCVQRVRRRSMVQRLSEILGSSDVGGQLESQTPRAMVGGEPGGFE